MRGQWAQSEANGLFCAEEETWVPLCQACLAYTCWTVLLRLFQSLQTGMVAWLNLGWNGRREAGSEFCAVPCVVVAHAGGVCENGRVAGGSVLYSQRGRGRGGVRQGQSRVGWIRDQSWKKIRWCVLPRYQRRRACLGQSAWHRSWILQFPRQRAETVAANDRRYLSCAFFSRSHQEQAASHQRKMSGA